MHLFLLFFFSFSFLIMFFLFTNRHCSQTTIYRRESISEALMRYWYCSIIWYIYFLWRPFLSFYFLSFFAYIHIHNTPGLHIVDRHLLLSSTITRYDNIKFFQQNSGSIYLEVFKLKCKMIGNIPLWIILFIRIRYDVNDGHTTKDYRDIDWRKNTPH